MRLPISVILAISLWAVYAGAQDDSSKLKVSKDALTDEQLAIYRVVLNEYKKDSHNTLNLSTRTYPLELKEGPFWGEECIKDVTFTDGDDSRPQAIHAFNSTTTLAPDIVLVDPKKQEAKVRQNDPQKPLKKAIDEGEPLTNEQLDESVKRAFSTGLFSLSEIIFDAGRHHAIVSYRFVCGALCGNGATLILEKVGDTWKVSRTCAKWIS